jgi:multicomponent Na+:H+ antiporter subunit G
VILQIFGLSFVVIGTFFALVGIIGIVRFPDVYTRIHASGKVSSLGIVNLLFGFALLMPEAALRALLLGLFLVVSAPVASHAIALAAHRQGEPRRNAVRDDLAARKQPK